MNKDGELGGGSSILACLCLRSQASGPFERYREALKTERWDPFFSALPLIAPLAFLSAPMDRSLQREVAACFSGRLVAEGLRLEDGYLFVSLGPREAFDRASALVSGMSRGGFLPCGTGLLLGSWDGDIPASPPPGAAIGAWDLETLRIDTEAGDPREGLAWECLSTTPVREGKKAKRWLSGPPTSGA